MRKDDLFQAAILHDCGVSKTQVHARLNQFEWENEAAHCVLGAELSDKLTPSEYVDVQRHSFDTYNILKNIHGLEEISLWAGQHHERIDGSGYPFHRSAKEISFESRIVAAADVFQALAQTRPYRGPLPLAEILTILKGEVQGGKLDSRIVEKIFDNMDACHAVAIATELKRTGVHKSAPDTSIGQPL